MGQWYHGSASGASRFITAFSEVLAFGGGEGRLEVGCDSKLTAPFDLQYSAEFTSGMDASQCMF